MAQNPFNPKANAPKDSGPKFKMLVRVAGLVVIGGMFLPFLMGESLLDFVQGFVAAIDRVGFADTIEGVFGGKSVPGALVRTMIILSYVFFPILGLSMVLRAKYAGGQFTFLLVFLLAGWLGLMFLGSEARMSEGFFSLAGVGFWVAAGGLFLPFVGMFFLDESI